MAQPFEVARANLYSHLHPFTFGKVVRDCKIVRTDPKTGAISSDPYFHGTVKSLRVASDDSQNATIWFKKGVMNDFLLGPIIITLPPSEQQIPSIGDILMGKTIENVSRSETGINFRYVQWYPKMASIFTLCSILRMGTAKTEAQLSHDLRLPYGEHKDQVWALVRLVLFGNLQVFVDQFNNKPGSRPMQIGPIDVFISECSYAFEDVDIWFRFSKLIPSVTRPEKQQSTWPKSAPMIAHLQTLQTPPRRVRKLEYQPVSPVYQPVSPVYQPVSPVYQPVSPVYQPVSPVYQPVSPVYQPQTPPSTPPRLCKPKLAHQPQTPPSTPPRLCKPELAHQPPSTPPRLFKTELAYQPQTPPSTPPRLCKTGLAYQPQTPSSTPAHLFEIGFSVNRKRKQL